MGNISKYIKKVEQYIEENPGITEELLVRYVYLDLGKRFSFNPEFIPFGNSKKRQQLYLKSGSFSELENCMENNIVICKSGAQILEYILKHLGVDIKTVTDECDTGKCPHVYNVINPKNGDEPYMIDLQEDMYHIQMHGFTNSYGISTKDNKTLVIPRLRQEQMDRQLGYIDNENYYTDEYLYLLKSDIGYFESFREKAKFILENIEVFENKKMQYTDRLWYHVRILQKIFTKKEFDYEADEGKIRIVDCYKNIDEKRKYLTCVVVQDGGKTDLYVYNKKEGQYFPIDLLDFAREVKNGLIVYNGKIPGLGNAIRRLNEQGERNK